MKFRILRFKKLRSTNDTAIRMVKSSNLNYGMIIADSQSNGRGQYGRKWISFKGNLFVSFFYCLLYTSPSPRDVEESRMPSSA